MIKNPGYMSEGLYRKILEDVANEDPNFDGKFCPYLMNEPFADKRIIDRIETAINILHNPLVEVSSNMELLTKERTDAFYKLVTEYPIRWVFAVSHHGINKETLERTMKINYEKTLKNFIYFIKKMDGIIPITIQNMAISKDSRFRFYSTRAVRRYIENIFEKYNLPTKNVRLSTLVFHNRAGNVKIDGWNYDKIVRRIDRNHRFDCWRLHNTLHVLWNGDVILCCMDYMNETCFGNLKSQTISEVFSSEKWKEIYEKATGLRESEENFICKRCMSPGG